MLSSIRQIDRCIWVAAAVAGIFFALEVVLLQGLTYATSYFYGQLIIALGLFGMLLGGFAATRVPDDSIERWIDRSLFVLPLMPLCGIGAVLVSLVYTYVSVLMLIGVFVPFGFILSLLYRRIDSWVLYAAELAGAIGGLVGAVLLIPRIREESTLLLLAVVATFVVVVWVWRRVSPAQLALGFAALIFFVAFTVSNIQHNHLNFAVDTLCELDHERTFGVNKVMCSDERGFPYEIIRSLGSTVDRIDIADTAEGVHKSVTYAGSRNDLIQPYPAESYIHDARIPGGIIEAPRVLIIGSGAEGVAKVAKAIGAEDITVVEYNPALVEFWRTDEELNAFSHHPFRGTTLLHEEGRSFLTHTQSTYDIITLMNTHRSINLRQFGQPDFLHTKEAFGVMFDRLTDDGFLSIEEPSRNNIADGEIAGIVATIAAALRERGIENPSDHVVVYQWVGIQKDQVFRNSYNFIYTQILAKRTPWSDGELAAFGNWAATSADTSAYQKPSNMAYYRLLWSPAHGVNEVGPDTIIARAAAGTQSAENVLLDERPFTTVLSDGDTTLLWTTLVLFALTIGLTLFWWMRVAGRSLRTLIWPSYVTLIGVSFMGVEMFLLLWLQFYTGSVVWAFFLTIGGLFAASALSAAFYWRRVVLTRGMLLINCVFALAALLLLRYAAFTDFGEVSQMLFAGGIVLFVGVMLAPFFPYSIVRLPSDMQTHAPLLVGLNGSALAIGVPLSLVVVSRFGFTTLIVLAIALYVLALLLLMRRTALY